ncbi:bifunctional methylenetetrahydrofolate dehydrogenase/methenyltetrahydrofolate cyclohydrolase FolD [Desulfobotulus sp.]|jgi:methylenetetrahydrofolate dehydrogenase (NADP+)/methenyltetrahydrofolate cyclohydrolase|uniref:bifunctional methylenetetrahydrofolate dehydrogenase/methenyltetrahydrofolate cyclohydrolase FolD n=1 Tax=Desulfobotulus sp. TaxID=1940337 RepID=UPI002A368689|nr:bifunctional methylenetetrahydrofolate dehydrogenase/methenyltetrahydrofolate cyclohydrolase FolD [Desulfobotulus sp.]MDY0162985.1 bifunctional methylenetetrahydrofolate dehydrogenase/methenyltetrahydrofolate cyclohydrolase FolD [Desulfobotulus sp.]
MGAQIIRGTDLRETILEEVAAETVKLKETHGRPPGLVTILVGENPASLSYVSLKIQTAHRVGFKEVQENLPADVSESELLALIASYNQDETIDGILVQLPLPGHMDESRVIHAIDPAKDVDAFHPVNVGRLMLEGSRAPFLPCTPAGIQEMLVRAGVPVAGAEVVVVGRSNIVGKPIANLLLQKGRAANATVTVAHTGTRDLASHCRRADILIVAAGVPNLVKPEWIKPGACVIDVGVNRVGERISEKTGKSVAILRGDVDYDAALGVAGWITPVPGGVGPMTIAMLMRNTLKAMQLRVAAEAGTADRL